MDPDSITVIIPTYNRAHLLKRAINSVLPQLKKSDELIIVDDGSTDNTAEITAEFGDKLRYIYTVNKGAGAARNKGIEESQNALLSFLDSDDEWMPCKLELQRAFMRARPDLLFCFTDFAVVGNDGTKRSFALETWTNRKIEWEQMFGPGKKYSSLAKLPNKIMDFNFFEGDLYPYELKDNYVNANSILLRNNKTGTSLRFPEDLPTYEDWEYFANLAKAGKCAYLACETIWQHGHDGPRLTDADAVSCAKTRVAIIERVWGKDEVFLKKHRSYYNAVLDEQRLIIAGDLISRGKTRQARQVLKLVLHNPVSYRFLAALPGKVTKTMLDFRRLLRS